MLLLVKAGETRVKHVNLYESKDSAKPSHGVAYSDSQNTISNTWQNKPNGIKIFEGNTNMYIILYENASEFKGQENYLNSVTIITQKGTNNIITEFPGNGYRYTADGIIGGN